LYQPPPFNTKLVALMSFLTFEAWQDGQSRMGSSENFCMASKRWPQSGQAYS
jgi:hypothetical protein